MIEMRAHFFGNVQGVGFRAEARHLADHFYLKGRVHNCSDGSVEVIAQGTRENLDAFVATLKKKFGSRYVKDVKVEFYSLIMPFDTFIIDR